MSAEARKLAAIRADVDALAGVEWTFDGAVIVADAPIATILPGARFEEAALLAGALDHARFLLGLLDRANAPRTDEGPPSPRARPAKEQGNYAAEAAMKCAEPAFKRYLAECHGLEPPLTDERCAARLRHVLTVASRRELNHDPAAARRWQALRADFAAWRRG